MRIYSHFAVDSLANSYVVGPDGPGDAVLIDPAVLDSEMLGLIEGNSYYVRAILVTHCDEQHLRGLHTLLRVYGKAEIYAAVPHVHGLPAHRVEHGRELEICGLRITPIALSAHSRDSYAFYLPGFLFPGCAMTAGEIGYVPNAYARAVLIAELHDRLLVLPDETVVFPFHGPPSTIRVERLVQPTISREEIERRP